jgi:TatD DNase family protein
VTFIDTHAHLFLEEFCNDLDLAVRRAADNGIEKIIIPNIDSTTINILLGTCSRFPGVLFPAIGLHPTSVNDDYEKELAVVEKFLEKHGSIENPELFYAIGETGIDLYWDKTYFEQQRKAFVKQLELSDKYRLPVIIHSRNSIKELTELISSYNEQRTTGSEQRGVFHCFPGNAEQAKEVISLGFKIGIGGVITFKNSGLQEVVKNIDLADIVLETDAPYLAPAPHRGKRNESSYINLIAEKIAEIKGVSIEEVAAATTQTAVNLFRI